MGGRKEVNYKEKNKKKENKRKLIESLSTRD